MSAISQLPPLDVLKDQARRLRKSLQATGRDVGHGAALELIAGQYGYRDWNTLHAAANNAVPPAPVAVGAHVSGAYLGQPFRGKITGLQSLSDGRHHRVTVVFDEPVDVVTFDSFSALRRRVTCTIDAAGRTVERTSNGRPHLQLAV